MHTKYLKQNIRNNELNLEEFETGDQFPNY